MSKKLVINAIESREIRAAILENGEPINFFVERAEKRYQKGNVYRAKITSIEPHLQAAFVELEPGQHGFLSVSDVMYPDGGNSLFLSKKLSDVKQKTVEEPVHINPPSVDTQRIKAVKIESPPKIDDKEDDTEVEELESEAKDESSAIFDQTEKPIPDETLGKGEEGEIETKESDESEEENSTEESDENKADDVATEAEAEAEAGTSDIDTAILGVEPIGNNENSESSENDDSKENKESEPTDDKSRAAAMRRKHPKIEEILEVGQYLVVQIIKEGIGKKAPMVTTFISLAGHYLVLTPGNEKGGISRQVRDQEERKRLREFMEGAKIPESCGLIIRTAASNIAKKDLQSDLKQLGKSWRELKRDFKKLKTSGVLKKEEGLLTRLVRDYFYKDIDEVVVDDEAAHEEIRLFFESGMSDYLERLKLHSENKPIFSYYKLDEAIKTLFRRSAPLPGGGSLIFDQGEAMLVIDINSGTFKEGSDDEDTAFKLNMLSCKEIAKQVQMRDVGGIIMIDFVDMRRISNRNKVERELEKAFKGDKAKINITHIGQLGVLEMSRQRTKDSLRNSLYSTCSSCEGTGLVPSKKHSSLGILRAIREQIRISKSDNVRLNTTADIAIEMLNQYKGELVQLEDEMENGSIQINIDNRLGVGDFSIIVNKKNQRNRRNQEKKVQNHHSQKQESSDDENKKRRRRRRPKRGRETVDAEKYERDSNEPPLGIIEKPKHSDGNVKPEKDESTDKSAERIETEIVEDQEAKKSKPRGTKKEAKETDKSQKEEKSDDEKAELKKPKKQIRRVTKKKRAPKLEESKGAEKQVAEGAEAPKEKENTEKEAKKDTSAPKKKVVKRRVTKKTAKNATSQNLKKDSAQKNTEPDTAGI